MQIKKLGKFVDPDALITFALAQCFCVAYIVLYIFQKLLSCQLGLSFEGACGAVIISIGGIIIISFHVAMGKFMDRGKRQ